MFLPLLALQLVSKANAVDEKTLTGFSYYSNTLYWLADEHDAEAAVM